MAAVAALLLAPKAAANAADTSAYEAYVDYYNQAVRSYYDQQQPSAAPAQTQRAGYGQAYGEAQATASAQRSQRPSQYGDYTDLDHSGTRTTAPQQSPVGSTNSPTGLPSFGQSASARGDQPRSEADESAQPSSSA